MGRPHADIAGQRFGRLLAVKIAGRTAQKAMLWRCRCDCGNETVAHLQHLRKGATTSCGCYRADVRRARAPRPLAERFWAKIQKTEGCWLWIGGHNAEGYGRLGRGERGSVIDYAHRVSWEIANGPIPDGLWALHRCDNPRRVRPDHLFLGDRSDNMRDCYAKGRAVIPSRWKGSE